MTPGRRSYRSRSRCSTSRLLGLWWIAALGMGLAAPIGCRPIEAPNRDVTPAGRIATGSVGDAADSRPLDLGQPLPEFALRDHRGDEVSPGALRGMAVVVAFVETDGGQRPCAELARRLSELQQRIRPDAWKRLRLLAVGVDADRPAALQAFARRFGVDPERWIVASGDAASIGRLAGNLGVYLWARPDGSTAHTLGAVVIDRHGRLADRFPGLASWSADDLLAAAVQSALGR